MCPWYIHLKEVGTETVYTVINRQSSRNLKGVHTMNDIEKTILDYTKGEATLEDTNAALKEMGSSLFLDPNKNKLTEEEKRATLVGYYPDQANGWGLMDHGVGDMEKVHVVNGKTVDVNMGEEYALVYIAGKKYRLKGDTLVEPEG